jgi:hypothetical protein
MNLKFLIIFFILATTFSCKKKTSKEHEKNLKSIVDNTLGKELILPDSLEVYKSFPNIITDSIQMSYANYKIYSHVNVSCSTCVDGIKKWDNLATKFLKQGTPIFLICSSKDNFELVKEIFESKILKGFSFPVFLDVKNKFRDKNSFMYESAHFETVLTDRNNKILLMGNPIYSKETEKLYLNELKKRINSEKKLMQGVKIPIK